MFCLLLQCWRLRKGVWILIYDNVFYGHGWGKSKPVSRKTANPKFNAGRETLALFWQLCRKQKWKDEKRPPGGGRGEGEDGTLTSVIVSSGSLEWKRQGRKTCNPKGALNSHPFLHNFPLWSTYGIAGGNCMYIGLWLQLCIVWIDTVWLSVVLGKLLVSG